MSPAKQLNVRIDADLHASLRAIADTPGKPGMQDIGAIALKEWLERYVAAEKGLPAASQALTPLALTAAFEELKTNIEGLAAQMRERDKDLDELKARVADLTDVNAAALRAAHAGNSTGWVGG